MCITCLHRVLINTFTKLQFILFITMVYQSYHSIIFYSITSALFYLIMSWILSFVLAQLHFHTFCMSVVGGNLRTRRFIVKDYYHDDRYILPCTRNLNKKPSILILVFFLNLQCACNLLSA